MMNLQGSWVAMPTPFTEDNQVDIEGFKLLIARQIKYGTNQLFILGSAGEVTLLSIEEKKLIVKSVIAYMKDRAARGLKVVPVFFSAASFTTEASVEFAQFCEAEGADGVVFTVPPYVLITQHAAKTHLDTCMSSVSIPCGIYNNPSRLGVQVLPETIKYLSEKHPNFVVDKEAMPSVEQLVHFREVRRNIRRQRQMLLAWDDVRYYAGTILCANLDTPQARQTHLEQIDNEIAYRNFALRNGLCPRCGGKLVLRHGTYGDFYGCSNYPACRYTLENET